MSELAMESGGSLVQRAVQAVRDYIRQHDLKVGDTLPAEGQFSAELGVSRAVMREAFGALAALKLIDVGNGRRAKVAPMDGSVLAASLDHGVATAQISVPEIWDVRRTVELRIAELAAERRTEKQAEAIVGHAEAMAASLDDMAAMTKHDIALHQTIAEAANNMLFLQMIRSFEPLMQVAVPEAWRTRVSAEQKQSIIALHRRLAAAIRDRDAAGSRAAVDAHFDSSIGRMLER